MHIKRQSASRRLPIKRKGTKFIVRTNSHLNDSVSLTFALRDMLKLAKNVKEVKKLIHDKALKINNKSPTSYKQSIKLFNTLHADKEYFLTLLPTGKFVFEEKKDKKRLCKVINKKLTSKGPQLNLHDGTNILSDDPQIKVHDSLYLDENQKISSHISLEKAKEVLVTKGRNIGNKAKLLSIKDSQVNLKLEDREVSLPKQSIVAIS
jgi:ribosomal protein S4E